MTSQNIKQVLLISILFASGATHAMPTAELCQFRGKLLEAMARERDSGTTQNNVVEYIQKQFGKHGTKRSTINEYASFVYSNRDLSPSTFFKLGEVSCLQEFKK